MTGAVKLDDGKPQLDLLPFLALSSVGDVLTYGAKKYAAHNWRKGIAWSRLTAAALRHVFAFMRGEDRDPESGLPHIDHAICCLLFLSELQKIPGDKGDDRWFKLNKQPQQGEQTNGGPVQVMRQRSDLDPDDIR